MELKWNLDELFSSPEACHESFRTIDEHVEKMQTYKNLILTSDNLKCVLDDYFACLDMAYKAQVYGSLKYYADIKSDDAIALKNAVEQKFAEVNSKLAFIEENILACEEKTIMTMVATNDGLAIYRLYLDDLFRREKHNIKTDEKSTLERKLSTLQKEYNDLISEVKIDPITVDGKEVELTLGNVSKYLAAEDHETRKESFENLNRAFEQVADKAAEILNEIYKIRIKISEVENYSSILESALDKENIDPSIVENLIAAVHKNASYLQKYMKLKAKYLGLDEPHLYDLGVPLDFGIKRKYSLEEGLSILDESFSILGNEYVNLAKDLIGKGHIDAIPNENRHPSIVFSWFGYSFLSYKDTYNSLKDLVHELGHSINDSLSMHLPYPYRISTLFTGETASITNEILLNRCLLDRSTSDEEKLFYLSKEIDNFITSMFRQVMYTELENILYKMVSEGKSLDATVINECYLSLLKKYYGDDIIYDELSKVEWTRLGKLYRWSFYSYNYATGIMIANAVYAKLKDGSLPVEKYIEFLSSGANAYSLDLLKSIGIDLTDDEVFDRGFEVLEEDLKKVEIILKDKGST